MSCVAFWPSFEKLVVVLNLQMLCRLALEAYGMDVLGMVLRELSDHLWLVVKCIGL